MVGKPLILYNENNKKYLLQFVVLSSDMTPLCLRITTFWVREKCHNYQLDYFFLTFLSLATVRIVITLTLEELFKPLFRILLYINNSCVFVLNVLVAGVVLRKG